MNDMKRVAISAEGRGKKKIAWLIRGLGAGGAEHLLLQDALELNSTYDISVAHTMSDRRHLEEQFRQCGVPVALLSSGGNRKLQKLGVSWFFPLRRWLLDFKPCVVHCHSPVLAIAVRTLMITRLVPSAPIIYTEHGDSKTRNFFTRYLNTLTMNVDAKLICVSQGAEDSIKPLPSTSEVIVHGVRTEEVRNALVEKQRVRQEWGVTEHDIVVGMMANFRQEKNHVAVFHAAKEILNKYENVYFVFYGQGVLEASLKEEIRLLELRERFLFEGYTDEPHAKMSGFDMLLLPSKHEGLPVVLMDAITLGIPSIITLNAGMNDIYEQNQAVYINEPTSYCIAEAIESLVDGEVGKSRRVMLQEELKEIVGKYSSKHYYARIVSIYNEL